MTQKTIFVVDDESAIAHALASALEQDSYRAIPFSDPLQALERAIETKPDLLLSDFHIPGLDGISLPLGLRERHPAVKILLMSADMSAIEDHPDRSHFQFLAKPLSIRRLLRVVKDLLEE